MKANANESARAESVFADALNAAGLDGCGRYLVAYSGGADSGALLHIASRFAKARGAVLFAAHVDHMIRGVESDRDRLFCLEQCGRLGVRALVLREDVPALAEKSGVGLEECARRVRYEFFADVMKEYDIPCLLVAHNASDNTETALFNLMRGGGLKGLAGIPERRPFGGGTLSRPLLALTKAELLDYCRAVSMPYVTDSTNAATEYSRNYIRKEIIPRLSRVCPDPDKAVARAGRSLREADDFIETCARDFESAHGILDKASLADLRSLHPAAAKRVIAHMYKNAGGTVMLEEVHLEAALKITAGKNGRASVSLPGDMRAVAGDGKLTFEKGKPAENETPAADFETPLFPGMNGIDRLGCDIFLDFQTGNTQNRDSAQKNPVFDSNVYKFFISELLYFGTIEGQLFVRNKRPGDRVRINGMSKSVKKLVSAASVPLDERALLPVLCDDDGIVCVPGVAVRDKVSAKSSKGRQNSAGAGEKTVSVVFLRRKN